MRNYLLVCVASCSIMLSSCGTTGFSQGGANTNTQNSGDLSSIIGNLGGLSGIGDILSSVLGVTTNNIVGTWTYEQPAVLFESDNFLTKAGGQVVAQRISSQIDGYFQKVGITKGKMLMTFDNKGNFTQTVSGKTQSGTYTLNDGSVQLTYQGGVKQFVGTTQFSGNNLVIVVDASKLLNMAQTVSSSSNNSQLSAISSIIKGFSGMKLGLKFVKQ
ncbi:MAG: DUF4923 family protein [Bacteroidaceae bacterium]|nr:DUF4923 family protein [Bacteroidaceae bacterium]